MLRIIITICIIKAFFPEGINYTVATRSIPAVMFMILLCFMCVFRVWSKR